MKKKYLKTGIIGYEKIIATRKFGKWIIYDKDLKKQKLTKKQLDKWLCS